MTRSVRILQFWLLLSLITVWAGRSMAAEKQTFTSRTGPWGELEYYYTFLEPPQTHLWANLFSERTDWFLPNRNRQEALQFLRDCGMAEDVLTILDSSGKWQEMPEGTAIQPPPQVIGAMGIEERTAIYAEMVNIPGTTPWDKGFNIEGSGFRHLAEDTLPDSIIKLVDQVTFLRHQNRCVCDLPWLMQQIPDQELQIKLVRCLSRTRAIVARLRITDDSDLDQIASYWSAGLKNKSVLPIIQAVRNTEGVQYIDVMHLLPASARQYVYTYLRPDDTHLGEQVDCFWAAVNFFQYNPQDRMLDRVPLRDYINRDFDEVPPPARFGDLVVLLNSDNDDFIHAWVQIADDIVYTKNGNSIIHPWLLMRQQDMFSRYSDVSHVKTRIYRRR